MGVYKVVLQKLYQIRPHAHKTTSPVMQKYFSWNRTLMEIKIVCL